MSCRGARVGPSNPIEPFEWLAIAEGFSKPGSGMVSWGRAAEVPSAAAVADSAGANGTITATAVSSMSLEGFIGSPGSSVTARVRTAAWWRKANRGGRGDSMVMRKKHGRHAD